MLVQEYLVLRKKRPIETNMNPIAAVNIPNTAINWTMVAIIGWWIVRNAISIGSANGCNGKGTNYPSLILIKIGVYFT